ncbi:MAG: LPS export ABC transporter periplasmic protein LptC [Candidatus Cloacimonetes bacterium]|nr:LPS export ABC transporter periplasmic protein LptC [Candidatus Cloacimonadota bacterium]
MKKFIILLITILLFCCKSKENNISQKEILESVEITDTLVIYSSSKDKIEWILYADYMQKFANENTIKFQNIKLEIFDLNENLSSTIFSDSAKVDEKKNIIYANGNVKIYSQKGDLFSNSLVWDKNKGEIFSDDFVKIIKDGDVILGERLRTDSNFEHVILQKVSAEGEVEENKNVW